MFPAHVDGVEDAYFWLQEWLNSLAPVAVNPEPVPLDILVDAANEPVGLKLSALQLYVSANYVLTVSLVIGPDLAGDKYRFDFRAVDNQQLMWRHDKHRGHEAEDGTERHRHYIDAVGLPRREPVLAEPTFEDIAGLIIR